MNFPIGHQCFIACYTIFDGTRASVHNLPKIIGTCLRKPSSSLRSCLWFSRCQNNKSISRKYTKLFVIETIIELKMFQVAHMTKSEMEYTDWSLMGPAMLFLNQYFNNFIKEHYILWLCMVSGSILLNQIFFNDLFVQVWVSFDLLRYCSQICQEICEYLRIELFRIPYHPGVQMKQAAPLLTSSSSLASDKNGTNTKSVKSIKQRSRSKHI